MAVVMCLSTWWGPGFLATAYGDDGVRHAPLTFDEKMYLTGIRRFCEMFASKQEPTSPAAYLRPVAVLAAMQRSFDTDQPVAVQPVPDL
jgi:hypothetical protein